MLLLLFFVHSKYSQEPCSWSKLIHGGWLYSLKLLKRDSPSGTRCCLVDVKISASVKWYIKLFEEGCT